MKAVNPKNNSKLPFGGIIVLYKFSNDIASQLLTLHAVNEQFIFTQIA